MLREEAVLKKQTQEMVKNFDYLENGDRNSVEFNKWQQEMKTNDLKQQIEQTEKLKLQSKISYEKAKFAREEIAKVNKAKAAELLLKNEQHVKQCMEEKLEEEQKRKQAVLEIKESEKNIKSIKEELIDTKKQIVKEVIKESEYLQRLALEEVIYSVFVFNKCGYYSNIYMLEPNLFDRLKKKWEIKWRERRNKER